MTTTLNDAQKMVLSAAFHGTAEVFDTIRPEMLDDPYSAVGHALFALHQHGEPVTLTTLATECAKRGFAPHVERWMLGPISADVAVRCFVDAKARETVTASILHAQQLLGMEDVDSFTIAADLVEHLSGIEWSAREARVFAHPYGEVLEFKDRDIEWVIPGLLSRRDRYVLTAAEGVGKSTWVYQVAICAGYGINPVDPRKRFPRRKVVILDVENTHETQVAWAYRTVHEGIHRGVLTAGDDRTPPDVDLLSIRDIDLLSPVQRGLFVQVIEGLAPDLLVMGSGYKLVDLAEWKLMASAVHRTVDRIKDRIGCAVLIETHAGHGFANDRNGLRPEGSADWMKWPEFGHGLAKTTDEDIVSVVRWRNDRPFYGSGWPRGWSRDTHGLPWRAIMPDEWEARDYDTLLAPTGTGKTGGWH